MARTLSTPTGPLAEASLALVQSSEGGLVAEHSIRSFHFARLLAEHEGSIQDSDYDEVLLYAATVMHDLGLGNLAPGKARFEVEGADLAASLLMAHGVPQPDVDRVWEAIALHSSMGIADRRGLLTSLTHRGVLMDIGRFADQLPVDMQQVVRSALPRPPGDTSVRDAIVQHASRSDDCAPPYSIAAELLRQARSGM